MAHTPRPARPRSSLAAAVAAPGTPLGCGACFLGLLFGHLRDLSRRRRSGSERCALANGEAAGKRRSSGSGRRSRMSATTAEVRAEMAAAAAEAEGFPERLRIEIHGADLHRFGAKAGGASKGPYAVGIVDGEEVFRTKGDSLEPLHPRWEEAFRLPTGVCPGRIVIAVRGAGRLGGDVLCGSVVVPCARDSGEAVERSFQLTRQGQTTGELKLSVWPPTSSQSRFYTDQHGLDDVPGFVQQRPTLLPSRRSSLAPKKAILR